MTDLGVNDFLNEALGYFRKEHLKEELGRINK